MPLTVFAYSAENHHVVFEICLTRPVAVVACNKELHLKIASHRPNTAGHSL